VGKYQKERPQRVSLVTSPGSRGTNLIICLRAPEFLVTPLSMTDGFFCYALLRCLRTASLPPEASRRRSHSMPGTIASSPLNVLDSLCRSGLRPVAYSFLAFGIVKRGQREHQVSSTVVVAASTAIFPTISAHPKYRSHYATQFLCLLCCTPALHGLETGSTSTSAPIDVAAQFTFHRPMKDGSLCRARQGRVRELNPGRWREMVAHACIRSKLIGFVSRNIPTLMRTFTV